MGLVLAFQTAPRRASRQPQPARKPDAPRTADILFFTGVRYERREDASPQGASPASGGAPTAS